MIFAFWTPADQAELDVLTYALVGRYSEHRERCGACQPGDCPELVDWRRHLAACVRCQDEAPVTHGGPCARKVAFVAHGCDCPRCNVCPALTRMVETVVEWRTWRTLQSKADWLRQHERANTQRVANLEAT